MDALGKLMMGAGVLLLVVGAAVWLLGRGDGGWLPGDVVIERKNVRVYVPIVTCLVLSAVLSLILWLLRR